MKFLNYGNKLINIFYTRINLFIKIRSFHKYFYEKNQKLGCKKQQTFFFFFCALMNVSKRISICFSIWVFCSNKTYRRVLLLKCLSFSSSFCLDSLMCLTVEIEFFKSCSPLLLSLNIELKTLGYFTDCLIKKFRR